MSSPTDPIGRSDAGHGAAGPVVQDRQVFEVIDVPLPLARDEAEDRMHLPQALMEHLLLGRIG